MKTDKDINLEKLEKILKRHKQHLHEKFNVKNIGVFGSYARGEQTEKSDLDILVEFDERIGFFKFLELEEHLENVLGVKVDLVTKKALKPRIGARILNEVVMI